MNISGSSLRFYENLFKTTSVNDSSKTQKTNNAREAGQIPQTLNSRTDSVSFSEEALALSKAPPSPPERPDFSSMSDEELSAFLETARERAGSIPGAEDGTAVSDLTSEQLQEIRDELARIQQQRTEEMTQSRRMPRTISDYGLSNSLFE